MPHKRSSYLDLVSPTYLENWPSSLSDLSIRQAGIALTPAEVNTLGVLRGIYTHRFKQQNIPHSGGRSLAKDADY